MVGPSGEQYEIRAGEYRAVVTESGGALRWLEHEGRPLVDGFDQTQMSPGGRGQVMMPWPNRVRDGRYSFGDRDGLQLALTEPARHNASHGLVRWVSWSLEEHTDASVSLTYRLPAQTGYPWTLDLHLLYDLSADGLTVTHTATNLAPTPAPYAAGMHPYLAIGDGPVDGWELTLPASTRLLVDPERLLPTGRTEPVEGTGFDFRVTRPIRGTGFDDCFTDLTRGPDGRATTEVRDPVSGLGVALWVDETHRWLQVFSADTVPVTGRRSLAVEPMTAPPDAFNSGQDLAVLAPAGEAGEELSASWGIRALA